MTPPRRARTTLRTCAAAGVAIALAALAAACAELGPLADATSPIFDAVLGPAGAGAASDERTVADGLREALRIGSERSVARVSQPGGFASNPLLRIALPDEWTRAANALRGVGLGKPVDDLEAGMNRAAETASAEATAVLWDAVRGITIQDAFAILRGSDDAATTYFRGRTETTLRARFEPVVTSAMQKVGVYQAVRDFTAPIERLPLVSVPSLDLEAHVTQRTLDGLYRTLALEEAKIRRDPAARTTELLRRVFGS